MEITRDDERARRICSLALEFMNAPSPIPSSDIARAHYPDLSPDSFRRAFARDREMLAACGVVVRDQRADSGEALWEADGERSFARGPEISPTDAAALEVSCRPLADDPSFPLAGELRFALGKLARAFSESLSVGRAAGSGATRELGVLRRCLTERVAAEVRYVDARGIESERRIAPYAFFSLRGTLYLVAAQLGEGGLVREGSERTYRVERFSNAAPLPRCPYDIPPDFSVEDYRRLPFQMGPAVGTATFEVAPEREEALRRSTGGQGTFDKAHGAILWSVEMSDIRAAASWAVSMGIVPREPSELVGAWRSVLEGVLSDVR